MEVQLSSLVEGARRARGTVVIVDVFRAFTTAAVALHRGAARIILVADPGAALQLRDRGLGDLCVGEVGGKRPEGFDFGNSPFEISHADVRGKTLIQSTRAGTVGVCAVAETHDVYAASLVVAKATAQAIRRAAPDKVNVVAMGTEGNARADEDELCAMYIRNLLLGREPDIRALRSLVLSGSEAAKFDDPELPHFHPKDRQMALRVNAFSFAIRVHHERDMSIARPVSV